MSTWIRLIKLTDKGVRRMRQEQSTMLQEQVAIIEENGGKMTQAFACLGYFDIVSIVEAPDEDTMSQIDKAVGAQGLYISQTLPAIPIEEFLGAFEGSATMGMFLESWLKGRSGTRGGKGR